MNIQTKLGWAALALALSCGPLLAQEAPEVSAAGPDPELMGPVEPGGPGGPAMVEPDGPRGPMGPGAPAVRGEWGHDRGRFERGRREFALSRLLSDPEIQQKVGITAEQVAKIRQQESAFRKAEIRQRADLQVKEVDLRDLLAADKPDRAAIDTTLQQISGARLALDKTRVGFRLDMKEALTPDQRQKLRDALRERPQARRGTERRGPGGPAQPAPGAGTGARPQGDSGE
jgi:Spy/CpxP family protein refolding chaperone